MSSVFQVREYLVAGIPRIHVLTVPKVMVQVGAMAIVHGRMSSAFQRRPPVRAKATVYGGMTSVLLIPVPEFGAVGILRFHVLTAPVAMAQVGAKAIVHGSRSSVFQRKVWHGVVGSSLLHVLSVLKIMVRPGAKAIVHG
uniref:Uncharacterized protein n=2 Tax=Eutreptiella gymnastica TaxID=73025 RepID=A0A7S4GAG3_9EUGL